MRVRARFRLNATDRDRNEGDGEDWGWGRGEGGRRKKRRRKKELLLRNGPRTRPNGNSLRALCSRGLSTHGGRYLKTATDRNSVAGWEIGEGQELDSPPESHYGREEAGARLSR